MKVKVIPWATNEFLNECFEYNRDTGALRWKTRPAHHFGSERAHNVFNSKYSGMICSCIDGDGYVFVRVRNRDGRRANLRGHRIAWAIEMGLHLDEVPEEIDHMDLCKSNNRMSNLREASRSQNQFNVPLKASNTSGLKGVCFDKQSGKWKARITVNGKVKTIGLYNAPGKAGAARAENQNLHGEFARLA